MSSENKHIPLPKTYNTNLTCAAHIIGSECADVNIAFLKCKEKDADPRACLIQGEKVTACTLKVLSQLESNCGEKYEAYQKALKKNWHQIDLCRKQEAEMEDCWRAFKSSQTKKSV